MSDDLNVNGNLEFDSNDSDYDSDYDTNMNRQEYDIESDSNDHDIDDYNDSNIEIESDHQGYYDAEKGIDINIPNNDGKIKKKRKSTNVDYDQFVDNKADIPSLMKQNYAYPETSDPDLLYKIYKKREFYAHRIPPRPDINDYSDIKEYRDNICARNFTLHEHQAMLSNYINPDTPYRGVLIFHGLGTGKCICANSKVYINGTLQKISDTWNENKTIILKDEENGEWSLPKNKLIVKSLDNEKVVDKQIIRLYREKVNTTLRKVLLENGKNIEITQIHKLKTENEWTMQLSVGNKIACYDENDNKVEYNTIKSIEDIQYDDYVYDVEVEDTHNYVANSIFAHNTCVGVAIAEKFKAMVQKYNTKIHILVSGPLIKESWKQHLLICTGETYLKYQDKSVYIDPAEEAKNRKNALNQALQYYRFMSYRSFYKRVLGEKIVDRKTTNGDKTRVAYRKTEEGEFERDIAVDRIYNLNNSIILVDEAHNLTGNPLNEYGEALQYIIDHSTNLRVVLLTATPMKNLADDIVPLLNLIRPKNSKMERDMIFDSSKNYSMELKEGGLEYFKNMARGYVSHVRGADPLIFARRVDRGTKPDELIFTKLIRCKMSKFQQEVYDNELKEVDDTLDRKSSAVSNFVFPGISPDRKSIQGFYGKEGITLIKNQLKTNHDLINRKIGMDLLGTAGRDQDLIYISDDQKTITGKILKMPYLKIFSTKFYKALKKLNRLVWGKKGPGTAFVYSNLVKVGIEIFEQVLLQNGYLEYQESGSYQLYPDTVCHFCGKTYKEHQVSHLGRSKNDDNNDNDDTNSIDSDADIDSDGEEVTTPKDSKTRTVMDVKLDISDSSTDYEEIVRPAKNTPIPEHKFAPATFLTVTGKSSEESAEPIPEEKKRVLDNVFSQVANVDGKNLKFVLGSKVMNEGISLKYVKEVHILDVSFNLGRVDQVVGRAIRQCSHYALMNEENKFPFVNVYKYVVTVPNGLSSEEELYQKAEQKYLLVKKIERAMKEVAIDCPLNIYGNMFKEEIEKYKHCGEPGQEPCPTICDYQKCDYKCDDRKLNLEYYDPERKIYKKISKNKLDYSTFTHGLARDEIDYAKSKIKELYLKKYEYTLDAIVDYVKQSYDEDKRDLFDEFFVYKGLDELIPMTENDFISFKDTVIDKFNRQGYLLYVGSHYIFQPLDQNEDVPMYYRTTFDRNIGQKLSLYNYLKNTIKYQEYKGKKKQTETATTLQDDYDAYNFDATLDYYDNRDEFKYVGIIDKEISRRKSKQADEIKDVFKIREKRAKILEKKRGTGIPSLKGAVCATAKNKEYLESLAKSLGIKDVEVRTRTEICDMIRDRMLLLEKYGTAKERNKLTYVMIPINHQLRFPYNSEDYIEMIKTKIANEIKLKLDIKVTSEKKTSGPEKGYPTYTITIKDDQKLKEYEKFLTDLGAKKNKGNWEIIVD